jgi:hypothetical protein
VWRAKEKEELPGFSGERVQDLVGEFSAVAVQPYELTVNRGSIKCCTQHLLCGVITKLIIPIK